MSRNSKSEAKINKRFYGKDNGRFRDVYEIQPSTKIKSKYCFYSSNCKFHIIFYLDRKYCFKGEYNFLAKCTAHEIVGDTGRSEFGFTFHYQHDQ